MKPYPLEQITAIVGFKGPGPAGPISGRRTTGGAVTLWSPTMPDFDGSWSVLAAFEREDGDGWPEGWFKLVATVREA